MSRCGVAGWGGTPAALKSAWWDQSFIGWKGSWQQSFEGLRTWDERKLLKLMPTSALERRAAIQPPLPARTTQTATHTHGKHAFISKHTNTDSGHHAYMYFLKSSTHSQTTHFGFLFNFESTRWLVVGDSGSSNIQDKYQQGVEWLEAQGYGEITEQNLMVH